MIGSRRSVHSFCRAITGLCSSVLSSPPLTSSKEFSHSLKNVTCHNQQCRDLTMGSYLELIISKVRVGTSENEVLQSLLGDETTRGIKLSRDVVIRLLYRFEDNWKSASGIFRWAGTQSGYEHGSEAYDKMVDILGKGKQIDRMWSLLEEMHEGNYVTLKTISKVMRRLAGAGKPKEAVKAFDDLGSFGLEKNTESMNLLFDTLCKEMRVRLAREIFLELKSHISPNAHTFNIFIHGWCNTNRVDEATWTIQEMKGHGFHPCVISYSTIIQSYCKNCNFQKVYEILNEMNSEGCSPNVVTYTTVMHSLAMAEKFDEALQIHERMKLAGCKPDTLFYNSLIHILGRKGRAQEATHIFEVEMPASGIAPNSSTYNTMIAMFCHHSREQDAFRILNEMEKSTFCKPDLLTYNPLLKLFFRSGKTDTDLNNLLDDMVNKHHLCLDLSTYSLLIHGLCNANKCTKAYTIFEEMVSLEIRPRYITCRLLLDEVKLINLNDVAEKIELYMKHMKGSKSN
ncbi:hypothetical protein GIB67_000436 [Kingdonia uniflora]|uniref:Pentatricopeptide repeat-containing protein n=1 Tax=Kingdonia uniflora TaxID=39325 RepID=A0A7J7MPT1_9MAGN|nr:hypothetical protein GIB67_000436 [Kingdonia uniflora]